MSHQEDKPRRNFLRWALGVSVLLLISGVAAVTKSLWTPGSASSTSFPRIMVGSLSSLKSNEPLIFNYPLEDEPNMLVKLGRRAAGGVGPEGDIVAFSMVCQHLGCTVGYQSPGTSPSCDPSFTAQGPVGYCCCHASVYDLADTAKVVAGPSPRPLPQVLLQVDQSTGDIYAVGMGPPSVFGHNTGSTDVAYDLQGGKPVG